MATKIPAFTGAVPRLDYRLTVHSSEPGSRFYELYMNMRSQTKERAQGGVKVVDENRKPIKWEQRHHTNAYRKYRETFRLGVIASKLPLIVGPVWMAIAFGFAKTPMGDGDNYEGWILDALQGLAYKNDKLVWVGLKQRYTGCDFDWVRIFLGEAVTTPSELGTIIVPGYGEAWKLCSTMFGLSTCDTESQPLIAQ